MGFVAYHTHGWQWIYWIFAITNGVQFILYFFFSPETLYVRYQTVAPGTKSEFQRKYLNFGKIGPKPITIQDFVTPITLFAYPSIVIPTIAYSIVFNFASVLATVEIPQIFGPKFKFNPQQIGLQFISLIIGSVLGEQLGGRGSDLWMRRQKTKGRSGLGNPEWRLWMSYLGFATVICGLVVFTVQVDKIQSYNVSPCVGLAISAFGNQIITTVLVTYAIDCHHEHAASIGVFINLVRSTWGFIGTFLASIPYSSSSVALICQRSILVPRHVLKSRTQWKWRTNRRNRRCIWASSYNLYSMEGQVSAAKARG
jgi:hypothetical protein